MSKFEIQADWEAPEDARGEELRATWARLSLLIDDTPITRVLDWTARSVRDAVYGPAFPLAEWIARNWLFLRYEVGANERAATKLFKRRHNIAYAGEGFALPDLLISSHGSTVEFRWNPSRRKFQQVEFLAQGVANLSPDSVFQHLRAFVEQVILRLDAQGLTHTSLHEEWSAIHALDTAELEFASSAAALGVDPFDATTAEELGIISVDTVVPEEAREEFLAVASPDQIGMQVKWFKKSLTDLNQQHKKGARALADFRLQSNWRKRSRNQGHPWQVGRACARQLRNVLDINGHPIGHQVLSLFGAKDADAKAAITYRGTAPELFHSVSALTSNDESGAPRFLITKGREDSSRFALCRAIFDYLSDSFEAVDLVADSNSNKQKANRAFAAEFLAPEDGLRHRIKTGYVSMDQIEDLASEFNVSSWVIQHQITDHDIAEVEGHVR